MDLAHYEQLRDWADTGRLPSPDVFDYMCYHVSYGCTREQARDYLDAIDAFEEAGYGPIVGTLEINTDDRLEVLASPLGAMYGADICRSRVLELIEDDRRREVS